MIRKKVMESISGKMEESIREPGRMILNMAKESSVTLILVISI